MRVSPIAMLVLAALAGCGSGAKQPQAASTMSLSSGAFSDGDSIPAQFGCDGDRISPPLNWDGVPKGTKSFALVMDDSDAPGRTFHHWGAFNIDAASRNLLAGAGLPGNGNMSQAQNSGDQPGYFPPCPPKGDPPHHYRFRLYALDKAGLELDDSATVSDVRSSAEAHKLAVAELTGTFQR